MLRAAAAHLPRVCRSPPPFLVAAQAEANQRELYGDLDPASAPWLKPSVEMKRMADADAGRMAKQFLIREGDDRVRSK